MKRLFIIILMFILLFVLSCELQDDYSKPIWEYYGGETGGGNMLIVGDKLIVNTGSYLLAFNKRTGDLLWESVSLGSMFRNPLFINGYLYVVNKKPQIIRMSLESGQVLDYKDYSSIYEASFEYIINDGHKIYAPFIISSSYTKIIVEIDLDNNYALEEKIVIPGRVEGRLLIKDDILYAPYMSVYLPDEQKFYAGLIAYNLSTNEPKWETSFYPDNGIYFHNPILYEDKMYISVNDYTREIDLETGEELRQFWGQGSAGSSIGNGVLFIGGWMAGYFLDTGNPVWEGSLGQGDVTTGSVYYKGSFYSFPKGVCRVDSRTGNFLNDFSWERDEYDDPVWMWDSTWCVPLIDEDTGIFYANGYRGIYAFKVNQ